MWLRSGGVERRTEARFSRVLAALRLKIGGRLYHFVSPEPASGSSGSRFLHAFANYDEMEENVAPPNPLANFLLKLQSDPASQNVVGAFDSLLATLTGSGPVVRPFVDASVSAALNAIQQIQQKQEREKLLGEIDRQLFLQFLESEVAYLKTHRNLKSVALYQKVSREQQICQNKQWQIRDALSRLFDVQQIDSGFYSALTAERGKTFVAFIKMKISDDYAYTPTIDDYIDARETSAVRKIMEQMIEYWADDDGTVFDAHDAWVDLRQRWDAWASKHKDRVAALKKYWTASGGGKDVGSNPGGIGVIKGYYKELYAVIESGNLLRLIAKLAATP